MHPTGLEDLDGLCGILEPNCTKGTLLKDYTDLRWISLQDQAGLYWSIMFTINKNAHQLAFSGEAGGVLTRVNCYDDSSIWR